MDDELKSVIRGIALLNASEHDGKTRNDSIISKVIGIKPELRSRIKDVIPLILQAVDDVNKLSVESQKEELARKYAELLIVKPKQERIGLPPLEGAEQGNVITRFPPEPNGYPHIGHAKASIIDEEYAKMYGGKLILRFDDTNPEKERLEYYAAIKVGLDWLGVKYDLVKNTSDDMEIIYKKAKELIDLGDAYVCTCNKDTISKNRREMLPCKCRAGNLDQNNTRWNKMFDKFKPGEAIVRFRGDMSSENTVMRDPTLLRIIDEPHPIHRDKYRVWPNYDFAVAIEDSIDGITHAFRTKEYELRTELYYALLDKLNMRKPKMLEFSRLEFEGMPVSKRVLKPLVEEGKVSGFDDPRLPTLEGLRRRGIVPEAIRKFVLSLGFTKSDTMPPFETLESINRTIIDPKSVRLFIVFNPVKLTVTNNNLTEIEISNHPQNDMGKRRVEIDGSFYIPDNDAKTLKTGDEIRLLELYNIRITKMSPEIEGEITDTSYKPNIPKIQWISRKNPVNMEVLMSDVLFVNDQFNENSLQIKQAITEQYYLELNVGAEIQFVRFGYCRKDSANQAIYTHK
ncbi:glutamate--tRNA ligase [Candidatus Nitrosotalea okcheonensis]|uniref:Glutamate--tRNA ligase n=1 Tax=Candidatus Nitrosotalea okcheonensis TaxID=1903276 RepID=A0A2H1FI88_9ARCH|nr:glutamate--tRNA ligase [Candidatus Nitrosotalea okcheonensis]SMH72434.1 Glutamate--tRNA ligase [Candidatus Nitrosotalea okcheonensis]